VNSRATLPNMENLAAAFGYLQGQRRRITAQTALRQPSRKAGHHRKAVSLTEFNDMSLVSLRISVQIGGRF
jgi:hypothetical protein